MAKNPGATGKYYWTDKNHEGPASEPVELVNPDGTLAGVTLKTLENAWGAYLDKDREVIGNLIIGLLNLNLFNGGNILGDHKK